MRGRIITAAIAAAPLKVLTQIEQKGQRQHAPAGRPPLTGGAAVQHGLG